MTRSLTRKKAIMLVKHVLYARRSQNIKREERALDVLLAWCAEQQFDPELLIQQVTHWLKQHDIAASMNGLV